MKDRFISILLIAICVMATGFLRLESPTLSNARISQGVKAVADDERAHSLHATAPSPSDEQGQTYRSTLFSMPLNARAEGPVGGGFHASVITIPALNRLTMREGYLCQASTKRPYSIRLLISKAHPGAAKEFYVYALRRLVI